MKKKKPGGDKKAGGKRSGKGKGRGKKSRPAPTSDAEEETDQYRSSCMCVPASLAMARQVDANPKLLAGPPDQRRRYEERRRKDLDSLERALSGMRRNQPMLVVYMAEHFLDENDETPSMGSASPHVQLPTDTSNLDDLIPPHHRLWFRSLSKSTR